VLAIVLIVASPLWGSQRQTWLEQGRCYSSRRCLLQWRRLPAGWLIPRGRAAADFGA